MDVFDASPIAVCMHIASVLYCAQHLTDGVIALRAMQRKVGGTTDDATLLIDAGLWHLPGHECEQCPEVADGKAYVHDYLQHNRTSDGVKGRSDAARIGATAMWEKKRAEKNRNANRMQTAYEPQCESDETAMPREKERKREREEAKASSSEPERPDVQQVVNSFSELLKANDIKHKPGQTWATAARLLIDKDGYTPEQILFVARFATTDGFWQSNILSLPKLREKFEALKIKAQAQNNPQPQRMDHSARVRAKEADMLARFAAAQEQPLLEIED